jgi:hypothetical protein
MDKEKYLLAVTDIGKEVVSAFIHLRDAVSASVVLYNELQGIDSPASMAEKKEAIVNLLNEYVDIEWVPEWLEDKILDAMIDQAMQIVEERPTITAIEVSEVLNDEN